MAICSNVLAWRIPWTEKPGGLHSMGLKRIGHNWVIEHDHCTNAYGGLHSLNTHRDPLTFCCSVAQLCLTFCNPVDCSILGFPVLHHLQEFTQTHVHWISDAIQPSHPLSSLLLPPSIFPSIRVFSNESALHTRWPKYWSFGFNISPSNEYSGLISFRMDWFDLLAVQGTLKSLLQHHSSKASILWCSDFFIVHPFMTTGKIIALTRWTFVGKVMSLFFNMMSSLVIAFLPRSKCLLISWL